MAVRLLWERLWIAVVLYFAICFALSAPVRGEIYRWIDERGTTHYSDQHPEGGEAEPLVLLTPNLITSKTLKQFPRLGGKPDRGGRVILVRDKRSREREQELKEEPERVYHYPYFVRGAFAGFNRFLHRDGHGFRQKNSRFSSKKQLGKRNHLNIKHRSGISANFKHRPRGGSDFKQRLGRRAKIK